MHSRNIKPVNSIGTILLLIVLTNLGILGFILFGYAMTQHIAGAAGPFLWACLGCAILAGYLTLRIKSVHLRLHSSDSMIVYSAGMLLSVALPFSVFLLLNSRSEVIQLGPMIFAQSVFMTIALGIKMNSAKRSFY